MVASSGSGQSYKADELTPELLERIRQSPIFAAEDPETLTLKLWFLLLMHLVPRGTDDVIGMRCSDIVVRTMADGRRALVYTPRSHAQTARKGLQDETEITTEKGEIMDEFSGTNALSTDHDLTAASGTIPSGKQVHPRVVFDEDHEHSLVKVPKYRILIMLTVIV